MESLTFTLIHSSSLLQTADIFFVCLHTGLILFNTFGWIWRPVRRANLFTLGLTGVSWFLLGIFYGIGFCPLTEWHWQVLEKLGRSGLPRSYTEYLVERLTGMDFQTALVNTVTVTVFFASLAVSLWMNIRMHKRWREYSTAYNQIPQALNH
ncbi:MAG: DUF2784 domain-containing protein [Spirochaetales bacterium]|nr:DUF2784 domain-containing protein [Spirochaetales bacterium]MCF7937696.1 DUF2784 domain-containing protein [Spirochaetales bacterium]